MDDASLFTMENNRQSVMLDPELGNPVLVSENSHATRGSRCTLLRSIVPTSLLSTNTRGNGQSRNCVAFSAHEQDAGLGVGGAPAPTPALPPADTKEVEIVDLNEDNDSDSSSDVEESSSGVPLKKI